MCQVEIVNFKPLPHSSQRDSLISRLHFRRLASYIQAAIISIRADSALDVDPGAYRIASLSIGATHATSTRDYLWTINPSSWYLVKSQNVDIPSIQIPIRVFHKALDDHGYVVSWLDTHVFIFTFSLT